MITERAKKLKVVEEEIIFWGKLISTCKPDTERLIGRIQGIDRMIKIRKGLLLGEEVKKV